MTGIEKRQVEPSSGSEGTVVREDEYCPICNSSNGHSLGCATFSFNRIEGTVVEVLPAGEITVKDAS